MVELTAEFAALLRASKAVDDSKKASSAAQRNGKTARATSQLDSAFTDKCHVLAKTVTCLRNHLVDAQHAYLQISGSITGVDDAEQAEIESRAQQLINLCEKQLTLLHTQSLDASVGGTQLRQHRVCVVELLRAYWKSACNIHKSYVTVRKRRSEYRKHILPPASSLRRRNPPSNQSGRALLSSGDDVSNNHSRTDGIGSSANQSISGNVAALLDESSSASAAEADISEEDRFQLAIENEQMFIEFDALSNDVQTIQRNMTEVAELQTQFTEKVLEQEQQIDHIDEQTVQSVDNVKDGNEQLRQAMQNKASFRFWILFYILVTSLTLWFLDWYNA